MKTGGSSKHLLGRNVDWLIQSGAGCDFPVTGAVLGQVHVVVTQTLLPAAYFDPTPAIEPNSCPLSRKTFRDTSGTGSTASTVAAIHKAYYYFILFRDV